MDKSFEDMLKKVKNEIEEQQRIEEQQKKRIKAQQIEAENEVNSIFKVSLKDDNDNDRGVQEYDECQSKIVGEKGKA